MNNLVLASKKLVRDRRGANLVEYILLVGVVALLALGAFRAFGKKVGTTVNDQATELDTVNAERTSGP